jgi:hypothetical protein
MVKISMMPLRGLPFGVRLNARLGYPCARTNAYGRSVAYRNQPSGQ